MSNDDQMITELEPTSLLESLGNSIKGIFLGLVFIFVASILLYWSEGRSVRSAGAIVEAERVTVDLPSIDTVDPAFNNKVIYAKGLAKTTDVLTDPHFNITTTAIALNRKIKFYQWVEKSKTDRGKKFESKKYKVNTFTYEKQWVDAPVNSGNFHQTDGHMNSVILQAPVKNEEWLAEKVSFGAYSLPRFMIASIRNNESLPLNLTEEQINKINQQLTVTPITQTNPASEQQNRVHVQENTIYLGSNQMVPQIGDVTIEFIKTPDTDISLIAQVIGDTFTPYIASSDSEFSMLSSSQESKKVIFQNAKDSNSTMTWIIRVLGVFFMAIIRLGA